MTWEDAWPNREAWGPTGMTLVVSLAHSLTHSVTDSASPPCLPWTEGQRIQISPFCIFLCVGPRTIPTRIPIPSFFSLFNSQFTTATVGCFRFALSFLIVPKIRDLNS